MAVYPTRLRPTGYLNINEMQILPTWRSLTYLQEDWTRDMLTDDMTNVIKLPSER